MTIPLLGGRRELQLLPHHVARALVLRKLREGIPQYLQNFPHAKWTQRNAVKRFLAAAKDKEIYATFRAHSRSWLAMMRHIMSGTALYDLRMIVWLHSPFSKNPYCHGYSWWDGTPIEKV